MNCMMNLSWFALIVIFGRNISSLKGNLGVLKLMKINFLQKSLDNQKFIVYIPSCGCR